MTYIKKATLTSYGKFAGKTIDLGGGLNVIYGPNEAGKTTTQTFIFQMLTGFPDKRTAAENYRYFPDGRDPEGILVLADENGEYTLERRGRDHLLLRHGNLADLMHGADPSMLRNLFYIEHADIREIGTLNSKEQRDRVFSAGITGAGPEARAVIDRLKTRIDGLGGSRKTATDLYELTTDMKKIETQLADARERAGGSGALLRELDETSELVQVLDADFSEVQDHLSAINLRLELQPCFDHKSSLSDELKNIDATPVPQTAVGRASKLSSDIHELEKQLDNHKLEARDLDRRISDCVLDEALWNARQEIEPLQLELAGYQEKKKAAQTRRAELTDALEVSREALSRLGPITPKQAKVLGNDVVRDAKISEFATERENLERTLRDARTNALQASQSVDDAVRSLDQNPAVESSDETTQTLEKLDELESYQRDYDAIGQESRRLDENFASSPRKRHAWWILAGALVVGLAAVSTLAADAVGVATLLALAAVALLFGCGYQLVRVKQALQRLHERREAIDVRLQSVNDKAIPLAAELNLPWPTKMNSIQSARRNAHRSELEAVKRSIAAEAHESAKSELQKCESDHAIAKESLERAMRDHDAHKSNWGEWTGSMGLPDESPQVLRELLRQVDEYLAMQNQADRIRNLVEETEAELAAWETKVDHVVEQCGWSAVDDYRLAVTRLGDALESESERRENDSKLRSERAALAESLLSSEETRARACEELRDTLEHYQVDDLGALEIARSRYERVETLEASIADDDRKIRERCGNSEPVETLMSDLEVGDSANWKERVEEARRDIKDVKDKRDDAIARRTELNRELDELKDSTRIQELEMEFESKRTDLVAAYDRWRQLKIARELIEEALKKFRRERQPDVLKEATKVFKRATGERYDYITLNDEDGEVVIRNTTSGASTNMLRMSPGTAEPLYLSLRLGLAAEFASKRGPLPVLMDDVLVNLDEDRRSAMIRAIASFSSQLQVIFFTCHRHIVDEFESCAQPHIVRLKQDLELSAAE